VFSRPRSLSGLARGSIAACTRGTGPEVAGFRHESAGRHVRIAERQASADAPDGVKRKHSHPAARSEAIAGSPTIRREHEYV